jgi:hypothetical protein
MSNYKLNRKLVEVICDNCQKIYSKPITEYNRNQSLGRHSFCSRSCACTYGNKHVSRNRSHLLLCNFKRISNPYLYYFRNIKKRFKEIDITIEDLKNQWEKQKGVCPYSGIQLLLASSVKTNINPIYRASLDRIDSNKGYIKENIQFVSTCINYMKNTLSDAETFVLCKLIAKNYT